MVSIYHRESGVWVLKLGPGGTVDPPAPTMLVGAFQDPESAASWATLESQVGASMAIRRSYETAIPGSFSSSRAGFDVGKRASWVSIKATPATVAAGGNDAALRTYINSVPANHTLLLTYWHEPENDSFTGAAYVAAAQHFYTVIKTARPQTIVVNPCYMAFTFQAASGRNPASWYPGDAFTDGLGVDQYNSYKWAAVGAPNTWISEPASPTVAFSNFAKTHGKPIALGEFASEEDQSGIGPSRKAAWIKQIVDYFAQNNGIAVCYFNINKPGDTSATMLVNSSSQSLAAYAALADQYNGS